MNFTIPYESEIDEKDKDIIDKYILSNIKEYENNSAKLTELTIEAVSSLSSGISRTEFLAKQGFLKNIFNSITGQNRKIRGEIDYNYAIVKNASLKMIDCLAKQNKITYEGLIYINNKLNNIEKNIEEELINICVNVRESFNYVLDKINNESKRIDSLEKKIELLEFKASASILEFNGMKYSDMDSLEKMICLINDLFTKICCKDIDENAISKENIFMIKAILTDFNVNIKENTKIIDIYKKLIEKPIFINKLLENTNDSKIPKYVIPILSGVRKIQKLDNEEKYITDSILKMIKKHNIIDIKLNLINEYGINISNFNYNSEINNYELTILIINELKMMSKKAKLTISNNVIINISDRLELAEKYLKEKKYKKSIIECNTILSKEKENKKAHEIKIECMYKILINETKKYEIPICYKEIAKIYLIRKDYENTLKYLNKYFDSFSSNKEIYKYKQKLKVQYKKIKQYKEKIEKKLKKISDKNKKEYLEFINDFWGVYLSKI